jgi:ribosomal protein L37AE/L43A
VGEAMSNRMKIRKPKEKILRKRCPKCKGRMHGKEYADKSKLWVCQKCKFPLRADS